MALTPIKKLVAVIGKYTDRSGQEKNRYLRVGTVFEREDGSRCQKMEAQPVGGEWTGWINEYPLDEDRQQAPQTASPRQAEGGGFNDDEIPFDQAEKGMFI